MIGNGELVLEKRDAPFLLACLDSGLYISRSEMSRTPSVLATFLFIHLRHSGRYCMTIRALEILWK